MKSTRTLPHSSKLVAQHRSCAACLAVALVAAFTVGACSSRDVDKAPIPTAHVRFAAAVQGSLSPIASGFGPVVSAPAHTRVLVMPFEGAISAVSVHVGDSVRANQAILTIARTPATAAQAAQARTALGFAEQDLARTQRLFAQKLSTNDQVATARKALADAQAQREALAIAGADRAKMELRAPFGGVITSLAAIPGDRPAVGTAMATVSSPSDLILQVGLQPADAAKVTPAAAVELILPLERAEPIHGRLLTLSRSLDPNSRLVSAVVSLPVSQSAGITLGMTLLAQVHLPEQTGIVVPRAAVLEDAQGTYVFTVRDGKAHRQPVRISVETDQAALINDGLQAAAEVIVAGNAGLDDGIAVESKDEVRSDPVRADPHAAKGEMEAAPNPSAEPAAAEPHS
jgi:RND family efflux transporter MFP subunit